ncbi:C25 family cysteine peptidase [Hymenobacter sp. 15J16-1T3B]|uniref:putative type IX secretion system sortase PorU2 n=1 Tax=Hymenobacter sp. 15J16-1T3B TaxID=2886941 RepID=UPI001D129740|nr:C25 family cysteine peptidase [Hymenobacter sp. 15J16-1T3B]MCC3159457.1 C25 family cysteine peptidase [Hymenobacter sp. 15J16-1T3B]
MTQRFTRWVSFLTALLWLLGATRLQAQSSTYGNEWIVPTQSYYKIKITKDGIYRLDHTYLSRAGIGAGTNLQRVQLWRRGREVALYGGGNQGQLDPTTYFEFYGQRNDGKLDRGMYKEPGDQPHQLYSLFTDTAAYFLTVSATTAGRRMTETTTAATGTVHANWLLNRLKLLTSEYNYGQTDGQQAYLSWADKGEAFLSPDVNGSTTITVDSLFRRAATGAQAWLETVLVGAQTGTHNTIISALPGGSGTPRILTTPPITYAPYQNRRVTLRLQPSDFGSNGQLGVRFERAGTANNDQFCVGYVRIVSPQAAHWPSGSRAVHFWNDSTLAGAAYYQLDSIPATVVGYDVTDPGNVRRTSGVALSGQRRAYGFATAVGSTRQLVLADAARSLTPMPAQRVGFRVFNPAQPNFIIVTSTALMQPAGSTPNPVRAYASYRATAGPGHPAYDTLVVTSELLYEQFHYGERSPLAVRQFAQYLLTAPRTDRYLLLLGRGIFITESNPALGLNSRYRQAPANERALFPDLVPASTRGASDIFFTADWQNSNYVPRMFTGRVPARTPAQVVAYLEKLRDHEATGTAAWRKNVLHLAGGHDANEHQLFSSYLQAYADTARKPLFGANVTTLINPVNGPGSANIVPQINAGVALMTYFGHGSDGTIDMQPPSIKHPGSGYAQGGKYPVFMAAGCAIGRTASAALGSLPEDWILAEGKGAIGWLAESDLDDAPNLDTYMKLVYRVMFREAAWHGKPIPAIQAEVLRRLHTIPRYSSIPASLTGQAMMTNFTWHGDPAVGLFSPALPDYQFTPGVAPISIEATSGGRVLASSPGFNLRLRLSNYGRIEPVRSIRITVDRTVVGPSGSTTLPVPPVVIPYFLRDTVLVVALTNPSAAAVFGNNTFTVRIDNPNVIPELLETNNSASLTYNFLNGGITILNPSPYAIVGRTNVRLVGQSNTPQLNPLAYEFQLDTIPSFGAPVARATLNALDVASWTPNLPLRPNGRDSLVYYWRVRFAPAGAPSGLDTSWVRSSFRFINGSPGGWSQSHYGQMVDNAKTQVAQQVPSGRWEFGNINVPLQLQTVGSNNVDVVRQATFLQSYGITVNGALVSAGGCGQAVIPPTVSPANIIAAVFDPVSIRQLGNVPGGPYQMCGEVGKPFYHFATTDNWGPTLQTDNINSAQRQAQLLTFLQNVPTGAYVALVSMNRVEFSSFLPALKAQLGAMGSQLINTAQDGDPLLLLLRKGFPGQTQESTYSPADPTPRYEQIITLHATLTGRNTAGTLTSTRIGPAQQWQTLYHTIKRPDGAAADRYTLRLVGYDASNARTVLNPSVTSPSLSLASVDARQYPYLALELELRDTVNLTPPQLKQWLVTYQGLPEGVVRRDHPSIPAGAYSAATLNAAATSTGMLNVPVYFENVAPTGFADLARAKAIVTETSSGRSETTTVQASRVAGFSQRPGADSTAVYNFRLNVTSVRGPATIRIVANEQELPEQVYYNNELNLSFTAPDFNVPPVLDVAFDGIHILNGDIVSPAPEVAVDVKYEDKRRPLTDPSKVQLLLTRPGSTTPEVVPMTNNLAIHLVNDAAAGRTRVYYLPDTQLDGKRVPLADGVYKLEVQAKDMGDNAAAAQRYGVTFEVVNKTSITHVFPYPNPITSTARFVFTLTGSTPPRNLKIQILTVSGKVVREILQSELGPLRIGNNVTSYAWDGTDEYGARLANGTYLYRVVLDDPEGQVEHRRTAADRAFHNGWGKLVLLR